MKKLALALLAAVASPAAAQIVDGSFEKSGDQSIPANGYCYFNSTCAVNAPWTGNGSGLIGVNSPAWPGVQGDGVFLSFVQGGGVLTQSFTADVTGLFALNWLDAGRGAGGYNGPHTYTVTLDGLLIGGDTTDGQTAAGQQFTGRTSLPFVLVAGQSYTLAFNGVANGDTTSFIDAVQTTAVPEPATWATMALGFGLLGAGLRSRRRATVATA